MVIKSHFAQKKSFFIQMCKFIFILSYSSPYYLLDITHRYISSHIVTQSFFEFGVE